MESILPGQYRDQEKLVRARVLHPAQLLEPPVLVVPFVAPDGALGHAFPEYHASTTMLFFYRGVQAGYSQYGALVMFEKFAKLEREYVIHAENPEDELPSWRLARLTGYFRSLPLPSERLAQARARIVQEPW